MPASLYDRASALFLASDLAQRTRDHVYLVEQAPGVWKALTPAELAESGEHAKVRFTVVAGFADR
jgi:hypothetical protein